MQGSPATGALDTRDELLAAWDRLIDRHGATGPQFDRWSGRLVSGLRSTDHDTVARAVASVGAELLGLAAAAPSATDGEEDAYWEFVAPRRTLTFEVKLAPEARRVINDDVEQAEGAARAAESSRGNGVRGVLITPHDAVNTATLARLERVRLLKRETLVDQADRLLGVIREYRRGWSDDAAARAQRRDAVAAELPAIDWLWQAAEASTVWIEPDTLTRTWAARAVV